MPALGEKWYGLGRKFESMMYLYIAEGIGSGIILNNELLKGSTGSEGEIGHTTILPNGPVCRCGSQGCLESLVSIPTVLSLAREFVKKDQRCALRDLIQNDLERVTLHSILEAAKAGDASCHKLLRQQAEYIGIAAANAVNMLDVQLVIIGGEMGCLLGEYFLPTIKEVINQRAQYFPEVQLAVSSLGMLAAPIGASAFLIGSRRK
jgi:glucokinase